MLETKIVGFCKGPFCDLRFDLESVFKLLRSRILTGKIEVNLGMTLKNDRFPIEDHCFEPISNYYGV
ncbi:hypothetical protein TSAR_010198 [Trichomalopsis sarcophagae]|uniref:Uncharacterized protein n=1 Tax=Trichomalopsis sarcophagae TaxID=543379 RepID=A0A232EWZ8_9HYME|nr:hypothetical protein TSAR_010198 [Trichomalopsis sarcophagae]